MNEKKDNMKKGARSKIVNEFKEFISRGSVMDLAVGIIIGSSFTAIVNSLVNDVITPLIGMFIGGIDFSTLSITLPSIFPDHQVELKYGNFIQAVINFFIVAVCVFLIIKTMNTIKKKTEQEIKKIKNTKPGTVVEPASEAGNNENTSAEQPESNNKETTESNFESKADTDPQLILLAEIRDLLKSNNADNK